MCVWDLSSVKNLKPPPPPSSSPLHPSQIITLLQVQYTYSQWVTHDACIAIDTQHTQHGATHHTSSNQTSIAQSVIYFHCMWCDFFGSDCDFINWKEVTFSEDKKIYNSILIWGWNQNEDPTRHNIFPITVCFSVIKTAVWIISLCFYQVIL